MPPAASDSMLLSRELFDISRHAALRHERRRYAATSPRR